MGDGMANNLLGRCRCRKPCWFPDVPARLIFAAARPAERVPVAGFERALIVAPAAPATAVLPVVCCGCGCAATGCGCGCCGCGCNCGCTWVGRTAACWGRCGAGVGCGHCFCGRCWADGWGWNQPLPLLVAGANFNWGRGAAATTGADDSSAKKKASSSDSSVHGVCLPPVRTGAPRRPHLAHDGNQRAIGCFQFCQQ